MKIKLGFVTNSSSTSFVVWGMRMDEDELKEKYGEKIFASEHVILGPDIVNKPREEFFEDFYYNVQTLASQCGIDMTKQCYDNEFMIGVSPFKMKEDQTLREFKGEIVQKFKNLGIDIEASDLFVVEECWMDG